MPEGSQKHGFGAMPQKTKKTKNMGLTTKMDKSNTKNMNKTQKKQNK